MLRSIVLSVISVGVVLTTCGQTSRAQSSAAITRMRPIGTPSAVDRFRRDTVASNTNIAVAPVANTSQVAARVASSRQTGVPNETAYWQTGSSAQPPVRQTVWMQTPGFDAPPLGGSGMGLPDSAPNSALPRPGSSTPIPNTTPFPEAAAPPRSLPTPAPGAVQPNSSYAPSPSDLTPVPQPSLDTNAFARVENCNLVTPPSTYMAASAFGCGCAPVVPATYSCPVPGTVTQAPGMLPAEIASPATVPPVSVYPPVATQPLAFPTSSAPARSLFTLGQENYAVQVGQGLWGQPVAYVPGQWLRNWMRYLSP